MKRGVFFRPQKFAVLFAAVLLLINSCSNFSDDLQVISPEVNVKTVSLTGYISFSGALPQLFTQSQNFSANSRSVFPSIPSSGIEYYVNATASGYTWDSSNVSFSADYSSFSITGLTATAEGVAWNIEVGIRDAATPTKILLNATYPKTLSFEDSVLSHDFVLCPAQTETDGTGDILLTINVESGSAISYCKTSMGGNTQYPVNNTEHTITISSNGVASGGHNIDFSFYDSSGFLVYNFSETINVFDNMTTDTWVRSGSSISSPFLVEYEVSGVTRVKCLISSALLDSYKMTSFFVKTGGNNANSGTFFSPLATIAYALTKLNDASIDYKIYIIGEVTEQVTIPDTLTSDASGSTHARSLTFIGYNGLAVNNLPQDSINGGVTDARADGTTLVIETAVPVTIKNLKITGGNTTIYGGGISVKQNATLKLGDGAHISGNICNYYGGGIYNQGKLFMYGSALVGSTVESNPQYYSTCLANGGNRGGFGGGVSNDTTGTMYMGYISETVKSVCTGGVRYNFAYGTYESAGVATGAGIFNKGTVTIDSGIISYNSGAGWGGGIATLGTVVMTGGTMISNVCTTYGGAIEITSNATLKLGGSVYIPFSGVEKNNDVSFYNNTSIIKITGDLTKHNSIHQIRLVMNTWKRGLKVLEAEGEGVTIDNTLVGKFAISDSSFEIIPWNSNAEGRLSTSMIYVAGSDYDYCDAEGDNTNGRGTFFLPYATIDRALQECWSEDQDFYIYVDGNIEGPVHIDTSDAQSIYISSNGSEDNGIYRDLENEETDGFVMLIDTDVPVYLAGLSIYGGKNDGCGGGICVIEEDAELYLNSDTVIKNNICTEYGGGIYFLGTTLKIENDSGQRISGNSAGYCGGGIYINHGEFLMMGGVIGDANQTSPAAESEGSHSNYAAEYGGGLYIADEGKVNLQNGIIAWNYAYSGGGGICIDENTDEDIQNFYYVNGTIKKNTSGENGGGILLRQGYASLIGGTITSNAAEEFGSGIYISEFNDYGFSMGLDAKVESDNYICIAADDTEPSYHSVIHVTSNLNYNPVAYIEFNDNVETDSQIIQVTGVSDSNYTKFILTDFDWELYNGVATRL